MVTERSQRRLARIRAIERIVGFWVEGENEPRLRPKTKPSGFCAVWSDCWGKTSRTRFNPDRSPNEANDELRGLCRLMGRDQIEPAGNGSSPERSHWRFAVFAKVFGTMKTRLTRWLEIDLGPIIRSIVIFSVVLASRRPIVLNNQCADPILRTLSEPTNQDG